MWLLMISHQYTGEILCVFVGVASDCWQGPVCVRQFNGHFSHPEPLLASAAVQHAARYASEVSGQRIDHPAVRLVRCGSGGSTLFTLLSPRPVCAPLRPLAELEASVMPSTAHRQPFFVDAQDFPTMRSNCEVKDAVMALASKFQFKLVFLSQRRTTASIHKRFSCSYHQPYRSRRARYPWPAHDYGTCEWGGYLTRSLAAEEYQGDEEWVPVLLKTLHTCPARTDAINTVDAEQIQGILHATASRPANWKAVKSLAISHGVQASRSTYSKALGKHRERQHGVTEAEGFQQIPAVIRHVLRKDPDSHAYTCCVQVPMCAELVAGATSVSEGTTSTIATTAVSRATASTLKVPLRMFESCFIRFGFAKQLWANGSKIMGLDAAHSKLNYRGLWLVSSTHCVASRWLLLHGDCIFQRGDC